ncbi:MAG: apolipoprotein N-acyltransferase [Xanthomonadaceae bacterium]|nr:apolipoprotein N-acyltransferase [Xanthomonadaceae bacterium]
MHALIWFALVPWFFALERTRDTKKRFQLGLLFSFVMTAGGFYWVIYALHNFGPMPYVFAGFLGILFFVIGQPQFYLMGPLFGWLLDRRVNNKILCLMMAATYTCVDYIAPRLFVDGMGYSLVSNPCASQWAEFGGLSLLTFWVIWVNALIYLGLSAPLKKDKIQRLALAALILVIVHGWGAWRERDIEQTLASTTANKLNISVIQANIGDAQKLASERGYKEASDQVIGSYLYMSGLASQQTPKPDAIIWPETAYPLIWGKPHGSHEQSREQKIIDLVKGSKVPLIFGAYDNDGSSDYNTLYYLEHSQKLAKYHKTILLPFAEYIPGFQNWKWFRDQFPQMGFFGPGDGPVVIETQTGDKKFKTAPLICYEGLFASFTRAQKKLGAEILLNVTNDSWFGPYGEPYLHLALTRLRSVETRTPLLRATNTGITTLVEPTGRLTSQTGVGTSLIANYVVNTHPFPLTPYVKYGDLWLIPMSILTLVSLLIIRKKYKHSIQS